MTCPDCGSSTVTFAVPESLRDHAPGEYAAICTSCLRVHPADEGSDDPEFDAVAEAFPDGEAGVALALALGKLGSLALERQVVVDLCEHAERAGADVLLTLDRLAIVPGVDPHFDIDRRRTQVAQFLD